MNFDENQKVSSMEKSTQTFNTTGSVLLVFALGLIVATTFLYVLSTLSNLIENARPVEEIGTNTSTLQEGYTDPVLSSKKATGVITSLSTSTLTITPGEGLEWIVVVSPHTAITEKIHQKGTDETAYLELNIDMLALGQEVDVIYVFEADNTIGGVSAIQFETIIETDIKTYVNINRIPKSIHLPVSWKTYDSGTKSVTLLIPGSDTVNRVSIPDETPILRIPNKSKILIAHAQTSISRSVIHAEDEVYVVFRSDMNDPQNVIAEKVIVIQTP